MLNKLCLELIQQRLALKVYFNTMDVQVHI